MLENDPELLVTTEINEERLEVTKKMVLDHFQHSEKPPCEFRVADWLNTNGTYDVVITNPPYFVSGKYNRRYFIDELILNSHRSLNPNGHLIFVQSSMADINKTKRRMEENGFEFEVLHQRSFPWRDYYFSDPGFLKMCDDNPNSHFMKNGERWEILYVVRGKLLEFDTDITH